MPSASCWNHDWYICQTHCSPRPSLWLVSQPGYPYGSQASAQCDFIQNVYQATLSKRKPLTPLHFLSSSFSSIHLLPPDFLKNYFPLSISPHNHPKHLNLPGISPVLEWKFLCPEKPPIPFKGGSCLSYLIVGWKLCESEADFWFHCCMYPQQLEQCLAIRSSKINVCWMNECVCKITGKVWWGVITNRRAEKPLEASTILILYKGTQVSGCIRVQAEKQNLCPLV